MGYSKIRLARRLEVRMKIEYSADEDALYVYLKEVEVSRSEDVD